jgi:hypothetical protein
MRRAEFLSFFFFFFSLIFVFTGIESVEQSIGIKRTGRRYYAITLLLSSAYKKSDFPLT